ncbi:MAG: hypothetical protein J5I65_04875, partial [Aridibacter famidurans]|nr:hypothetical protein [Aridibacter famidurans]
MKRGFEFLSTLCILFVLSTGASAQYGPESKFLLQVGAEYVGRPLIKTEFNKEDLEKYGDVTQFRHYRFTSDRVGDKYVNFNPELSLTVYVYKDPETPISSLSRLQEASKNWKIKTPEVAIVDGNSLYRLKGHC